MAVQINFGISQDLSSGNSLVLIDTTGIYNAITNPTGWGSPNADVTSVAGTRLIFGDYYSILSPQPPSTSQIIANQEFTGKGGVATNFTAFEDNNQFTVDNTIAIISGTATPTGRQRLSGETSFLPKNASITILPTQIGYANPVFNDSIYQCQYECYGGNSVASGSLVAGVQYMVVGGVIDYVKFGAYASGFINEGEIFIALANNDTFTTISGTPHVYPLQSAVLNYFPLTYYSDMYVRNAFFQALNTPDVGGYKMNMAQQMYVNLMAIKNMFINSTTTSGMDIQFCINAFNQILTGNNFINNLR